jgi:hypothetical protein
MLPAGWTDRGALGHEQLGELAALLKVLTTEGSSVAARHV